ncbi:MAG: OsmC family protein [Nitrospiraceae bacterium]|nr:OsmC family protein [Nitrospiraceae bacterium]
MENEHENIDLSCHDEKNRHLLKTTLNLEKDLVFKARTQSGYEIDFDANVEWGCMPTESLLMSLSGCHAIYVVSFLRKMKVEIASFKMNISGERRSNPPQYFRSIEMVINISGKNITPEKMDKAISLSKEKYCSVQHSLRKDLKINVKYNITNE